MMATRDSSRIMLLEEEVRSLSEELVQCQADKEFVWSLWKRLQVANPDLTQAVSLVVEREKWKAEAKDRKVLEILQAKDYKLQELDQRVTGQQQEITNLVQRKMAVDEDRGLVKKELAALRRKLGNKSQELKDVKEERRRREAALEEEKEGLESCCSALRGDLEQAQRQERRHGEERDAADAKVKEMEGDLSDAQRQVADLQGQCSSLADLLSSRQKEVAQRDKHVTQLGRELQEVQALYRQSSEHAAEQAQLIQQLEGLNLDTQRVLLNQEEAHTADTTSYQKLYNELSICYQALKSNEGQLRQSHVALTTQLGLKEQQIVQLQGQLQQQQQQQTHNQQQLPQTMAPAGPPARQTNSKHFEEQTLYDSPDQEPSGEEAPASTCSPVPQEPHRPPDTPLALSPSRGQHTGRQQSVPVQRSRSLSPASSVESGRGVEKRIHDLEELLRLKTEENEELRRAHEKRHERLRLVQTNYRTVKDQLREVEDAQGLPRGRTQQRAEPWQLRQENSDAVWNELAYFKHLNKKLTTHKTNLEEELDVLRVQAAMDRATVQELRLCLQNEQQELLHKVAADPEVKNSTPKKPSAERVEQSLKKIEQLERRTVSMEQETERLREDNQDLQEANTALTQDKEHLQGSLARLRTQGAARDEAAHAQALAQGERHRAEALALETQLEGARREAGRTRQQLLRLRQELGILRAARDFNRSQRRTKANMLTGLATAATAGGGISGGALANSKVKFKTGMRPRGPARLHRHRAIGPNQAIGGGGRSPARDDWEDISADSGEEYSDSLDSHPVKSHRYAAASEQPAEEFSRTQPDVPNQGYKQREPGEEGGKRRSERKRRKAQRCGCCAPASLRGRVLALQRHLAVLQTARRDAQRSSQELRDANEKITSQLAQRLNVSKQLSQKLTSDLAGVEQQKKVLEMELEQWRQIHRTNTPQQLPSTAPQPLETPSPAVLKALEAEVKQLHTKLKSSKAEVTRHMSANKALRAQLLEREEKLRELQEKVIHTERDVHMKRQLVEDVKTRMKFLLETEKTHRGLVEELEKKVKTLTEEATNRKAFTDSLKRRLSVATKEKSQYETTCQDLKEGLDKKEQCVEALQARVRASERAQAELEQTASRQMEGLAQQSTVALEALHRRLGLAHTQLEQLQAFTKALASETLREVQDAKSQLRKNRKRAEKKKSVGAGGLSKQSMVKAQSIAASILNMTEMDLAEMLDTDEEEDDVAADSRRDQEWLDQVMKILQQEIPSAALLMEVLCVKMKERKVLTEALAALTTPVSEIA
ncbi:centlein isoform X1 [Salmo salar]|uniref:Centlein isoform X1 n=1 Tax=Salmo salar TaxID=8030 RepID=A0ABM3EN08_SALSA|nr:centlein isoform X1 [Salmo salar]